MPNDEFELLLERCRDRLSEINLSVPTLESGRKMPVYSLTPPAPVSPPKPVAAPKALANLSADEVNVVGCSVGEDFARVLRVLRR